MKINFTKKDYETLLEMLFVASYVITAFETDSNPENEKYEELEQKILSHSKDFGMDNLVMFDSKFNKYFFTRKFEEGKPSELIDEFEEETFWDELTNRLAERDFIEAHTEEELEQFDVWDKIDETDKLADKYSEEFEENGLNYLRIQKK